MTTKSLRELAAESTNATEESKGTPKKKSFASLLRGMNQDAKVVQKKGGPVKPATSVEVQAEIPELVRGLFYRDANGVACGYTNDKGVTACVFEDKFGIGGIKGDIIKGVVIKYNKHGALVSIKEGVAGLVHNSTFPSEAALRAKLELGKNYNFQITLFEPKEQKMTLIYLE